MTKKGSTGMTGRGGTGMMGEGATEMTRRGCWDETILFSRCQLLSTLIGKYKKVFMVDF